jgi:hypothetical protein
VIFFFHKNREQEDSRVLSGGVVTSGREEDVGRGYRRVNMVQILCTHVCKLKNETC